MRKIIYHIAITLDGFIAHPDGTTGGFLESGEHVADYLQSLKDYDTVIMGRKTYEYGYDYGVQPGAPPYPHMMHYIFSRTLHFNSKHAQVEVVSDDEVGFVERLKQTAGSPIYLCGGGRFAGLMFQNRLIDEIKIKLNPIFFGTGISLFDGVCLKHQLKPLHQISYDSGVQLLHYEVVYL